MGVLDDIADDLAMRALRAADKTGNEELVDQLVAVLGASSQTLEEAYKTSVRVRRAELLAREMLGEPRVNLDTRGQVTVAMAPGAVPAAPAAPAVAAAAEALPPLEVPPAPAAQAAPDLPPADIELWPDEVTLEGDLVKLVPLELSHAEGLAEAVQDGAIHQLELTTVAAPGEMEDEIRRRLSLRARGTMLPFATLTPEDKPVGMTTYMNIDAENRRVEIGSTWLAKSAQRTGINTEAKKLMLEHAFETLECIAVEFRTHRDNRQSRTAIERLGARLDGILRAHMRMPDGSLRDSAVYSITAEEWPAVQGQLRSLLNR
ncbi:GNAT family N-acetyltransferase [Aestuariibius sp. 2305UL40-4]|uniref:GNAT family N-acetyltransferase n=1 Tax=Aestuariibius violaceus TaxID=3234132 RepID=UPI00345E2625